MWPLSWPLGIIAAIVGYASFGPAGILAGIVAGAIGAWIDSFRRCSVLFYDVEDNAHQWFSEVTIAFDSLAACSMKWHVDAGGRTRDIHAWKRNAGASHLIEKRPTSMGYGAPKVVRCNLDAPMIKIGKATMYLFPDVILVEHNGAIGAVSYDQLEIRFEDSRFIEDGTLPRDAKIIDHTWRFVNKNGDPDRRFNGNRRLPICLYESMYMKSNNGLNELIQLSRSGFARPFAEAVRKLSMIDKADTAFPMLPSS